MNKIEFKTKNCFTRYLLSFLQSNIYLMTMMRWCAFNLFYLVIDSYVLKYSSNLKRCFYLEFWIIFLCIFSLFCCYNLQALVMIIINVQFDYCVSDFSKLINLQAGKNFISESFLNFLMDSCKLNANYLNLYFINCNKKFSLA